MNEDTALKIALAISKEEAASSKVFDNYDFTDEEVSTNSSLNSVNSLNTVESIPSRKRNLEPPDGVTSDVVEVVKSKKVAINHVQTGEFNYGGFNEEEILKISEIESNQDNNFTVIACLRNDASEECAICLEVPVRLEVVRRLRCMHVFHKKCFDDYFQAENNWRNKCPICQMSVIEAN